MFAFFSYLIIYRFLSCRKYYRTYMQEFCFRLPNFQVRAAIKVKASVIIVFTSSGRAAR